MIFRGARSWQSGYPYYLTDVPTSSCILWLWLSSSTRIPQRQCCMNSTLQSQQLSETSHFVEDSITSLKLNFTCDCRPYNAQDNPVSTATLLQWCGNVKSLTIGMCIHDCSVKHKLDGDSSVYGKLIHMYSRCGDVKSAHALFLYSTQHRSVFVWNVMIRAYAHLGHYQMAFDLFNQMLCEGMSPDNFTMVCVITACGHVPLTEGRRMHVHILASRFKTDHLVGNALLNMYSKCGSVGDVRKIFIEMPERNTVAWTAMIDAFLQHGCKDDALQFLGHMQGEGEFPDRVFFLSIIAACSDVVALLQGKLLHVSILEMGYESDIFVRTALVNMYGNCGALADAREVFASLYEKNVVLWNSIISMHTQSGLDAAAFQQFHQMMQEGVLPDRVTFIHGLSACANNASLHEGMWIHTLALSGVPVFDVMLGTTIVYMYGKCGHLEAACEAFNKLCERSVVSWNVMLGVLTQHGEYVKAFEVFGKMQTRGVIPDK
eukprot:c19166_g1_i1 orf=18-1484(+)